MLLDGTLAIIMRHWMELWHCHELIWLMVGMAIVHYWLELWHVD